jgi:hypothetical protein
MRWNDWVYRRRACSNRSGGWTRRKPCRRVQAAASAALPGAVGTKLSLMLYRIPLTGKVTDRVRTPCGLARTQISSLCLEDTNGGAMLSSAPSLALAICRGTIRSRMLGLPTLGVTQ